MASVIAETPARKMLNYALGKERVSFAELSQAEGDDLLRDTLREVDLRELRGFVPLKELLTFRPGSVMYGGGWIHTLNLETLDLSDTVSLQGDSSVVLETQVMRLSRSGFSWRMTFKRHESQEETGDREIASSWGRSAYHYKGSTGVLVVRRPRNHTSADENLFSIDYWYKKVPLEQRHLVTNIDVTPLPFSVLRTRFGATYGRVAVEIIEEFKRAYARTAESLENKLEQTRRSEAVLRRLSDALSY